MFDDAAAAVMSGIRSSIQGSWYGSIQRKIKESR